MSNVITKRPETTPQKQLNVKQELFCKMYATDPNVIGNATQTYMQVYGQKNPLSAKVAGKNLLDKPEITARIQYYLSLDGFNNEAVDKKHNFLIHQNKDFNVSLKAIQEYNKLKQRVSNQIQIVMPKPIMDLDDDETIHKIDKSKVKDIQASSDVA